MKYLFASLVILPMQMLFLLAFTAFALCVGISTLSNRVRPQRAQALPSRKYLPAQSSRARHHARDW